MIKTIEEYQVTDSNGEDIYYEDTEVDAVKLAKHLIRESLVNGEWECDPRLIKVSKVLYEVEEFDRVERPLQLSSDNEDETGEHWPTQCDFKCGYQLVKVPFTIQQVYNNAQGRIWFKDSEGNCLTVGHFKEVVVSVNNSPRHYLDKMYLDKDLDRDFTLNFTLKEVYLDRQSLFDSEADASLKDLLSEFELLKNLLSEFNLSFEINDGADKVTVYCCITNTSTPSLLPVEITSKGYIKELSGFAQEYTLND